MDQRVVDGSTLILFFSWMVLNLKILHIEFCKLWQYIIYWVDFGNVFSILWDCSLKNFIKNQTQSSLYDNYIIYKPSSRHIDWSATVSITYIQINNIPPTLIVDVIFRSFIMLTFPSVVQCLFEYIIKYLFLSFVQV